MSVSGSLLNGISTFVGNLMPKTYLLKDSCGTIQSIVERFSFAILLYKKLHAACFGQHLSCLVGLAYNTLCPLQRGKTIRKGFPAYDTKLHLMVTLHFCVSDLVSLFNDISTFAVYLLLKPSL